MGSSPGLLGAILAGGKSSRMGVNKACLRPWGESGSSLLENALELLAPLTARCVVSCARGHTYAGHECIEDAQNSAGPAQGLLACLQAAKKEGLEAVFALGCDQPALTGNLLGKLADAYSARAPGSLAALFLNQATGKFEMLVAIYSVDFIPLLVSGLEAGQHSLYQILPKSRAISLAYSEQEARYFVNLNTPAQFQAFSASCGNAPGIPWQA
ncbi:MAG: molybdenum cofactor guanylyltransferase [Desulfovibrio sp.]|nr:molybdenum cofactor guanylyltransferase [Desulfovibrio sp.]